MCTCTSAMLSSTSAHSAKLSLRRHGRHAKERKSEQRGSNTTSTLKSAKRWVSCVFLGFIFSPKEERSAAQTTPFSLFHSLSLSLSLATQWIYSRIQTRVYVDTHVYTNTCNRGYTRVYKHVYTWIHKCIQARVHVDTQ